MLYRLPPTKQCFGERSAMQFTWIPETGRPSLSAHKAILRDYCHRGYALFEVGGARDLTSELILNLADSLSLGKPFIPPLYAGSSAAHWYDTHGINTLKPSSGQSACHPAFDSCDRLPLHTDGSLQPLGLVRSVVMVCITPAREGGDTTIFDAVAAFNSIRIKQPHLARALLNERALVRRATVNGSESAAAGPVFEIKDGVVGSRYSVTQADDWLVDECEDLAAARSALEKLAQVGSLYYSQLKLGSRQGILLANDRISHGRTAFLDAPMQNRHMLRSLFVNRPA